MNKIKLPLTVIARYANKKINNNYYKEIVINPSCGTLESSNIIYVPYIICNSQAEFNEIMRKKLKSERIKKLNNLK
jgi:hypothetical protein